MRKPEEIMSDVDNRPSMKILGMMEYGSAIKAIILAQKEAYNEAINDAASNSEADSRWKKGDTEEPTPFVVKKSILKLLKK